MTIELAATTQQCVLVKLICILKYNYYNNMKKKFKRVCGKKFFVKLKYKNLHIRKLEFACKFDRG